MPKVVKQSPAASKRKPKGVVDRIAPVSLADEKDKINIYGVSGTGKTTLACTWPKPLLIAGAERGTRSVHNIKGVKYVRLQECTELDELVSHARESGKYQSFVLDTATSFQAMCITEIAGLDEPPVQKSWGMASRDQWGQCALQTKEYLRRILRLAEDNICHAIVLAQERTFGSGEDADEVLAPTVMSALTASTVGWLNPECDYIVQTFIREQRTTSNKKVGNKTRTFTKTTGDIEYCLRTRPHPLYTIKFRGPKGHDLPVSIVDPDFTKIRKLIDGKDH